MSSKNKFYKDLVFSGFGGQGILIAGNLLCYAALLEDREVTFFPSYGVEMRGGAANCYIVISNRQIGSPIPSHPEIGMIMSLPALKRFENVIKSGGTLFINSDIISPEEVEREDVKKLFINANSISKEVAGSDRLANMVMLGYLSKQFSIVKKESLISAIKEIVSEKHKKMIPLNEKAILAGYNFKEIGE